MTAQIVQPTIVSDEILVALRALSPHQCAQVTDFARFLAQKDILASSQPMGEVKSKNWVEEISGSMKDVPEFDVAMAYGRAFRESEMLLAPLEEAMKQCITLMF
jgi:hypothetical protein